MQIALAFQIPREQKLSENKQHFSDSFGYAGKLNPGDNLSPNTGAVVQFCPFPERQRLQLTS